MADRTDPHGSLNPDWHPNTSRFTLHLQPEEPTEEYGWRYKITVVDLKYLDSDSYPIDSIASGNNWQEAFSSAAHMVETALASDRCVF